MSLGKRLKIEREKRNWSQKYVAERIGITNTVLSNYERDYRDPDTETLKKLADLYEVYVDYLLGRNKKWFFKIWDWCLLHFLESGITMVYGCDYDEIGKWWV